MRFPASLRFRLPAAIVALFTVLAISSAYTLYLIDLRKHDYAILNLSGQLRVISHELGASAEQYLQSSVGTDKTSNPAAEPFLNGMRNRMDRYSKIIEGFKKRQLSPELTGRDDELKCSWDKQSRNQLDLAAEDWEWFRSGFNDALGESGNSSLEAAARFVRDRSPVLVQSAKELTTAFQGMMEHKLASIRIWNIVSITAGFLLMVLLLFLLTSRVLKPLQQTTGGFKRVTNGEYGYQVPEQGNDELTEMTRGFNALSSRLNAVFRMTERINRGLTLKETMDVVCREFRSFLPLDWAMLISFRPDGCVRVSAAPDGSISVPEPEAEETSDRCLPDEILQSPHPVIMENLEEQAKTPGSRPLLNRLIEVGLQSAMILPLNTNPDYPSALVIASRQPIAYQQEDRIFMESLAGQVARIIDRTVIAENLIVAVVEGLAKLAENRDPETGDHLIRMSMYASFIAASYIRIYPDEPAVTPDLPGDIRRFAPMHDIGKVGVPDQVLLKPGRLNPDEWGAMKQHPAIGGAVLRRVQEQVKHQGNSIFKVAIDIAEYHHEKFDGSGYPHGLSGKEIPLAARIVTAADVFDALTSRRPYKEPWTVEEAVVELEKDAGTHFDPDVIAAFRDAMPRIRQVYDRLKHV